MINKIIHYHPLKSVEEMKKSKFSYIDFQNLFEFEKKSLNDNNYGMPQFSLIVKTKNIEENEIESINETKLLEVILDRYVNDFKESNNNTNITLCVNLPYDKLLSRIMVASNMIAASDRIGTANVIILPKHLYINKQFINSLPNFLTVYENTLNKYQNKIFLIRKNNDLISFRYLLVTDKKIKDDRVLKINKLLKKPNNIINYVILTGCSTYKESYCILDIV